MSNLSDVIESFIKELIDNTNNATIEIQRNLLAQQFDCSPSQINYVLTTRFNNDKGYGFITANDGNDVFVHHSNIKEHGHDKDLHEGEEVSFDVVDAPKGLSAINVLKL